MHAILRFDGGHWVVVDKSQNGVFVDGARSNLVPIRDRLSIALGGPRGPDVDLPRREPLRRARPPVSKAPPPRCSVPRVLPHRCHPHRACNRGRVGLIRAATSPAAPLRSATIGRAKTNSIVVEDALASRVHAMLTSTPAGLEIRDNDSSNGTFVNGTLITSATLRDGDVVTIGNTDLLDNR